METAEHVKRAGADVDAALDHATQAVKALRRWTGDKTFEHPIGLAGSHLYLGTKRVGAASAHMSCVPQDSDQWQILNDGRNAAESRLCILSSILSAARDVGEKWMEHEKEWSDIRESMRTAEPWIFAD